MPLFRYLGDDAFLIFSRKHRYLYEAALLDVYDRFFSSGAVFPMPQELVHAIYNLIARRPDLLADAEDPVEGLPEVVSKGRRRLKFTGNGDGAADRALKVAHRSIRGWSAPAGLKAGLPVRNPTRQPAPR
ncbi:hypothetical protein PDO_2034 [Rhizobium sp. PDO1-076]|uniref:hypothetical protein n=1 Tax=Rhizobium sp. PDO1-076 TaxID=1125979 RepID=UPI00024E25BD|nr:hypothetical protein [Rhizobium sp. PDO1-076]EHS51215.1 hypothetical protein PDO_2034 [Rhizobium sp. PDO1-076]